MITRAIGQKPQSCETSRIDEEGERRPRKHRHSTHSTSKDPESHQHRQRIRSSPENRDSSFEDQTRIVAITRTVYDYSGYLRRSEAEEAQYELAQRYNYEHRRAAIEEVPGRSSADSIGALLNRAGRRQSQAKNRDDEAKAWRTKILNAEPDRVKTYKLGAAVEENIQSAMYDDERPNGRQSILRRRESLRYSYEEPQDWDEGDPQSNPTKTRKIRTGDK